jgi:formylglycine-generating enzyme required for sulfatase activity
MKKKRLWRFFPTHYFLFLLLICLAKGQVVAEPIREKDSEVTVYFPGELPVHFQLIRAGSFTMGSAPESVMGAAGKEHQRDESPRREVTLTKDFYLGIFEVTQRQWMSVMGANPAVFQQVENFEGEAEDYLERAVESVSWDDCQKFIEKLNGLGIGDFRLPTEAEWEYACRAGTTTRYYWGNDPREWIIHRYAWANSRSYASTHPVGLKLPNAWGLYDMSGNVWEWCADGYGPYSAGAVTDPKGNEKAERKVFRGGSWFDFPESHRSANRHAHRRDRGYTAIGLRLVLELELESVKEGQHK